MAENASVAEGKSEEGEHVIVRRKGEGGGGDIEHGGGGEGGGRGGLNVPPKGGKS